MSLQSADALKVRECIDRFSDQHRHPDRPKLIIHEPHTMSSWEGTDISYKAGCYVLYSAEGELLYIGKASNTKSVGSRLVRFRYSPVDWKPPPQVVQIIEVPQAFEAPSLEEFLIGELQPRFNDRGIKRRTGV